MEIQVKVTPAELAEMGLTKDTLVPAMIQQLDEAILPSGREPVDWCGYWVTVTVTE